MKNKFRNKLYGNLKCKQNKDWTCADISERKFLNSFKIMKKMAMRTPRECQKRQVMRVVE